MPTLYLLWHFRDKGNGATDAKSIGTYTSEDLAKQAIELLRDKLGFKKYPDGFQIIPCTLDRVEWPDGFPPYPKASGGIAGKNREV